MNYVFFDKDDIDSVINDGEGAPKPDYELLFREASEALTQERRAAHELKGLYDIAIKENGELRHRAPLPGEKERIHFLEYEILRLRAEHVDRQRAERLERNVLRKYLDLVGRRLATVDRSRTFWVGQLERANAQLKEALDALAKAIVEGRGW